MSKTPKIGSASSGTFRNQDRIQTLLNAVRNYAPDHYTGFISLPFGPVPAYVLDEGDSSEWWDSEEADDLLSSLIDVLDSVAPDGCYFGSHPGNPSDLGFWLYE